MFCFFFFQAEDGIRDLTVTGVQTCALPICWADAGLLRRLDAALASFVAGQDAQAGPALLVAAALLAQMEGRGHSCLPLAPLAGNPNDVLAWPAEEIGRAHV